MIKLDFSLTIIIITSLIPVLVICWWIFYTMKRNEALLSSHETVEQCPFCTYLFFESNHKPLSKCPRCQSLLGGEVNYGES